MNARIKIWLCLLLVLPLSCTTLKSNRGVAQPDRPNECRAFFDELDSKVAEAGARDASSFSVAAFPYLRTNRFLAALNTHLKNEAENDQWIQMMAQLNLEAREKEILNLPDDWIDAPKGGQSPSFGRSGREVLLSRVRSCSREMLLQDRARPEFLPTLREAMEVPDEYSFLMRSFGLYPLASLPIAAVNEKARKKFQAWYDAKLEDLPIRGRLRAFDFPIHPEITREQVGGILERSRQNPLKIPLVDGSERKALVELFAPLIIQDVGASYDYFGRVEISRDGLKIDGKHPTVYYYLGYAFLHSQPILQINYVIWYPERAGKYTPWMEKGRFDGLTFRISLDGDGQVFMMETMNNCGCYHVFIPRKEAVGFIRSKPLAPDAFVPQWLPEVSRGERLSIRVNSGWHQVERVLAAPEPVDVLSYELAPYEVIESLPAPGGRRVSMFNGHGIVEQSRRIEPLILFSAGIRSIGYMRQRGHHAIEFIGREHFDDPHLFGKNFLLR